jgi:uncharacterized membrane protein YeaQ/YmgE (transglycosylase-associated protein family)
VDIVVLVLIGFVIGFLADTLTPGRILFGWLLSAGLGILGSFAGNALLVAMDPLDINLGSVAILPAIVGALVPVLLLQVPLAIFRRPRS